MTNKDNRIIQTLLTSDKSRDLVLDQFAKLTAKTLGMQGCFISFLDEKYQYIQGVYNIKRIKFPRAVSLCQHVVNNGEPLVICDTHDDIRSAQLPIVTNDPYIRFYASVPLFDSLGNIPGTLCITDTTPHSFTPLQLDSLKELATLVQTFIDSWHFAGFTDPVTGISNRQRLIHDLNELKTNNDKLSMHLILIDCLDISQVYELTRTMGIAVVEDFLYDIALVLLRKLHLTKQEKLYTISTGRFAVIICDDDINYLSRLTNQLQGIRANLGENISIDLTLFFGEKIFYPGVESTQEIFRQAVSALHEAISRGVISMAFEPAIDTRHINDFMLMNDLSLALQENRGLHLVFQPKVCLRTERTLGVEALIRWNHPIYGELSPASFLPLAEQTNLLSRMTTWVIDSVIKWLKELPAHLRIQVTVNVSEKDFSRHDFADHLGRKFFDAELHSSLIGIECLETESIVGNEDALSGLDRLKKKGFSISLDDFGTGYSNINYLKQMPLDVIKLDRSLIFDLTKNKYSQIIVSNIITMLKQLDYQVLAEGVEDEETLSILKRYGCDQVQGYIYSRPLNGVEIQRWLGKDHKKIVPFCENQRKK